MFLTGGLKRTSSLFCCDGKQGFHPLENSPQINNRLHSSDAKTVLESPLIPPLLSWKHFRQRADEMWRDGEADRRRGAGVHPRCRHQLPDTFQKLSRGRLQNHPGETHELEHRRVTVSTGVFIPRSKGSLGVEGPHRNARTELTRRA